MLSITYIAPVALVILIFSNIVCGQNLRTSKTIVTNSDPQITYAPPLCSETSISGCIGTWWDTNLPNGSVIKTTAGPSTLYNNAQTTLSYSFYGSSLEIHGLVDIDGANMVVQLDNFLVIVNTSTGIGGTSMQPSLLFNRTELNPQVAHTLSVGWSANMNPNTEAGGYKPLSYAYFDRLLIGNFRVVASPLSSTTASTTDVASSSEAASSAALASSAQASSSELKPSAVAGIAVSIVLIISIVCGVSFCLLRRRFQLSALRRQSPSSHIRVMIESQEIRHEESLPSPTHSETWKARPHLSLPPAYGYAAGGCSDKTGHSAEKGVSYLDLESGNGKSTSGTSASSGTVPNGQQKRKSRASLLPVTPPPSRPSGVGYPPRPKLRVNTRQSVISPRFHPFVRTSITKPVEERDVSPVTPFTPYCVGTATVARPQNAHLIRKSSLGGGELFLAPPMSTIPLPPLPPLPPLSSPKEEKHGLGKYLSSSRRSRKISRARTMGERVNSGGDSNALEVELSAIRTSRPSFDTMSVMTRSVPPPYTLHVEPT